MHALPSTCETTQSSVRTAACRHGPVRGVGADVGSLEVLVDVVRAFGQLRDDDAGRQRSSRRRPPWRSPAPSRSRRSTRRPRPLPTPRSPERRPRRRPRRTSRPSARGPRDVTGRDRSGGRHHRDRPAGIGPGGRVRGRHRAAPWSVSMTRRLSPLPEIGPESRSEPQALEPAARTATSASAAGTAWTTRIRRLTVAAPYSPPRSRSRGRTP